MITLHIILGIIVIHFFGDFILQTDWQAKNKSTNWIALLRHTVSYSTVWLLFCNGYSVITGNYLMVALFPLITFICHTITDYFTSRWVKKSFDKQDHHYGFVKIGFDQVLHYTQLFLTYYFLTN